MSVHLACASAVLALAASACLADLEPDVGAKLFNSCTGEDSDPDHDVAFERDIRLGIMSRADVHCVACHTPDGATPVGVTIGGLDISSYATIALGGRHSAGTLVVPDDPCSSILLQKLGPAPPFGDRMPKDGPPYLTNADAQVIIDWIAEGARDN
jgi:hypothetical protein